MPNPKGVNGTSPKLTDEELLAEARLALAAGHSQNWLRFDLEGRGLGTKYKRLKEAWAKAKGEMHGPHGRG